MADPIFERYKDALKAGHVALLRDQDDEAMARYREAAGLAPERALPHASLGGVLLRLGRTDEALAAFDRALELAPRDEAALNGRVEALLAVDRPNEAAQALDRLAEVQLRTERRPEALATLWRAEAIEASRSRRRRIRELSEGEAPPGAVPSVTPDGQGEPVGTVVDALTPPAAVEEEAGASPDVDADADAGSSPLPKVDPEASMIRADALVDEGRALEAASAYADAAQAFQASDQAAAAFDACQRGLEAAPGSALVHVRLAELYLAEGRRDQAVEKLVLLDRLMVLASDAEGRAAAAELGRRALSEDPRMSAWLATLGDQATDPAAGGGVV